MAAKLRENFLRFIGVNEEVEEIEEIDTGEQSYSTRKPVEAERPSQPAGRGNVTRRGSGTTPSANIGGARSSQAPSGRITTSTTSPSVDQSGFVRMVVFQPQTYDDTQTIIDNLKTGKPVIVNLETLNPDIAQRVLDFIGGAIYALDGNVRKVSKGIFLLAPEGVDIAGNFASDYTSNSKQGRSPFTTPKV
ncbi:MAG: cell division protein SepF [Eubacteriales bacterium]